MLPLTNKTLLSLFYQVKYPTLKSIIKWKESPINFNKAKWLNADQNSTKLK